MLASAFRSTPAVALNGIVDRYEKTPLNVISAGSSTDPLAAIACRRSLDDGPSSSCASSACVTVNVVAPPGRLPYESASVYENPYM